jgi:tight adherence protein C
MTIDDLIALLAGVVMVMVLLAMWHSLRIDNHLERRLAALAVRRGELRERMLTSAGRRKTRPSAATGLMHSLVHQFDLLRSREATDAQILLARAGLRTRDAMVTYLFCKMCLPFGFGAAALIDAYWLPIVPISEAFRLPIVMVIVIVGFYAPRIYLKNVADKRGKMLQKGLPDGLDLMVICAEAGLSLDATFARVARELGKTWPELADELGLTAVELTFLPERRQALDNLNSRANLASFRGVVNTLQQSEKFGTPLAQSLRVLAMEFREQRLMRAEEKAARLPAVLTVPMMIFILPTLFIVLLGPAVISTLDNIAKMRR